MTPALSRTCCLFSASPASGTGKQLPAAPPVPSPCTTVACSACWRRRDEADEPVRVIQTTGGGGFSEQLLALCLVVLNPCSIAGRQIRRFTPVLIGSPACCHSFIHIITAPPTSQITPNRRPVAFLLNDPTYSIITSKKRLNKDKELLTAVSVNAGVRGSLVAVTRV